MKTKKIFISLLVVLPVFLLANEGGSGHYMEVTGRATDFVPRLFNFAIFAALLYYLIAEPVRNFFVSRREDIAEQLREIENRLQKAREDRKAAEQAVVESEKKAEEILRDAEKEISVLKERYKDMNEREIQIMQQQHEERMALEERKMQRDTIVEILDENIKSDDIPLDGRKIIEILSSKAA